jgi:hypothetical protein
MNTAMRYWAQFAHFQSHYARSMGRCLVRFVRFIFDF